MIHFNEYTKERIKAAAYKLSYGIRFRMALNLTQMWLSSDDMYSKNIITKETEETDIVAQKLGDTIMIKVEEDIIII